MTNSYPQNVSRRSVTAGTLWSAPAVAIAAAAPAVAVSACVTYTGAFTQPSSYNPVPLSYTFRGSDGSTVTVSLSTASYGGKTLLSNNLTAAGNVNKGYNGMGDLATDGLQLQQQGTGGQRLTFTFSQPVSNLSFVVADIDNSGKQHKDSVTLSPTPSVVNGSAVTGSGVTGDPLRTTRTSPVNSDNKDHRSTVTMAGPLSSMTVDFSSSEGTVAQQIFITGMTFEVC